MNERQKRAEGCRKAIFLTGFMGSGKSTVGRQLSRRLELPFTDMDRKKASRIFLHQREKRRSGGWRHRSFAPSEKKASVGWFPREADFPCVRKTDGS